MCQLYFKQRDELIINKLFSILASIQIGELLFDKHGMPLLNCSRGTSKTENVHKHLVATFGEWNVGTEMSCYLLQENRHRSNQHASEINRADYPVIGHYDTWLVDLLQILVEKNHGVLLYSNWSNASDYIDTDEQFDTIPIQSSELNRAVESIRVDLKKISLTQDQK